MIQFKLERAKKAQVPKLDLGRETFEKIGAIAADAVVLNIKTSKQADGSLIKANAPSTARQKRSASRTWQGRVAPLIAEQLRFIQTGKGGSWRWTVHRDHVVIEPSSAELRRLSRYVQQRGYVGWFGLSKKAWGLVREILRAKILESIKRASGR